MLTKDKRSQRGIYQEFMAQENFGEIHHMFEKKNLPSVLGSEKFIEWVKDRFFQQKSHEEIPQSRQLAPERETIKQVVCNEYHVSEGALLTSRRGTFNESRNVAIYLSRQLRGDGLSELCKEFQMKRYSSARSAIERLRAQMSRDTQLRKRVEK